MAKLSKSQEATTNIKNCSFTTLPEPSEYHQRRAEAVIKLAEAIKAAAEALRGPDSYGVYINR